MTIGTPIFWINRFGEHIPGVVLELRKTEIHRIPLVKVRINDFHGDRITWVKRKNLEVQS